MPVTIKSTGGGSVTVQAPNTASDYTVNFPASNGDMVVAVSGSVPASQGGTGQTSLTANNVILGNGTSAVQFVAPGTSGNVLTSNGTTWSSAAPTSTGINVQTFNASGTWTKPSLAAGSRVLVQAWGGGGSGGRNNSNEGGGGGGGYNEGWFTLSSFGATETITIGAGGVGVSSSVTGNTGGTTTVGSLLSAYGGGGGSTGGAGGGGGGQFSAGNSAGIPGRPYLGAVNLAYACANLYTAPGVGNGVTGGTPNSPIDAFFHGGGGGAGAGGSAICIGAFSVWGGGGGGGYDGTSRAGGTSLFGGNGGSSANGGTATAGTQPGGGGGASNNGTSGAGGAGRVIITVFPA